MSDKLLLIDNGTKHMDALESLLHVKYLKMHYSKVDETDLDEFSRFILSGRVGGGAKVDRNNVKIIKHAASEKKPLFGICYGAHILAMNYGCKLGRMGDIRVGNHKIMFGIQPSFLLNPDALDVWSSHRYIISLLSDKIESLANSKEVSHEMIRIKDSEMYGTQFHPEKTRQGIILLRNWLDYSSN